jgi:hypothetical protein
MGAGAEAVVGMGSGASVGIVVWEPWMGGMRAPNRASWRCAIIGLCGGVGRAGEGVGRGPAHISGFLRVGCLSWS